MPDQPNHSTILQAEWDRISKEHEGQDDVLDALHEMADSSCTLNQPCS